MAENAVEVHNFYRTKWGHHDEFLELFKRNHLPILRELVSRGQFLGVKLQVPRLHGDGRADWDVLVTIVFRDWAAVDEHHDAEIAQRLYPDQATFREEERRRFEILDAHWDILLTPVVD
jgi:hypothetical protein